MAKRSSAKKRAKRTSRKRGSSGDAPRRRRAKSSGGARKGGRRPASSKEGPRTEGERRLRAVDESTSQVAARLGKSKQTVSCWRRGTKLPSPASRALLEEAYGIERTAWDRTPAKVKAKTAKAKAPKEPPAKAAPPPPPRPESPTLLQEVEWELAVLRQLSEDKDLSASVRARLSDSRTKLISLRARLEREQELVEDRLVREHPMWLRIREVLEDFVKRLKPEDAREMRAAIAELGGG